jgi:hypothetical protein
VGSLCAAPQPVNERVILCLCPPFSKPKCHALWNKVNCTFIKFY